LYACEYVHICKADPKLHTAVPAWYIRGPIPLAAPCAFLPRTQVHIYRYTRQPYLCVTPIRLQANMC